MMIARWHVEARFGHKQEVIDSMRRWNKEIGAGIGWTEDRMRLVTGSLGAKEAVIESEVTIGDLAELDAAFAKLATIDAHKRWSKELEPHVVSGSMYWEIFRVL